MRFLLALLLLFCSSALQAAKSAPGNDDIDNAMWITNTSAYCSNDAEFNNIDATASPFSAPASWTTGVGKDVWFKFVATKYDVNISVSGKVNASSLSSLSNPLIAVYQYNSAASSYSEIPGSVFSNNNVTSFYKGALTLGDTYYIRISAQNNAMGSFKLCLDNYFPPVLPGQDCSTASVLCTKETFTQLNVSGAGNNRNEANGTCIVTESNSAWYKFTAKQAGSFTFVITPTVSSDDIDWVMFDLGPNGNCNQITPANVIRCAAGSGVTCSPSYYKTGLSLTETDLSEPYGCAPTSNGFVKYVDLVPGNTYAILINNFSNGNNGFTMEFGGTAELEGPKAEIKLTEINPCTENQSFIFESNSQNYSALEWNFGPGASLQTATTPGPHTITYSTPGEKILVLKAKSSSSCKEVIATKTIYAGPKPATPVITVNKNKICEKEVLELSTPYVKGAQYFWSGPNSFTSQEQNPQLGIVGEEDSGEYKLYIQVGNCMSDVARVQITANYSPQALFALSGVNTCKADQYFLVTNTSINYAKVTWDFGEGVKSVEDIDNVSKKLIYATSGKKTIKLTVENTAGCSSVRIIEHEVKIGPDKPSIQINQSSFCLNDVIELSTKPDPSLLYSWKGPDGFTASTPSVRIPVTNLNKAGRYELSVAINGCSSDIANVTVPAIDQTPIANFSTNPNFNTKFSVPVTIGFINSSQYAHIYQWDFGDGTTSSETSPEHIYTTEGTYKITLNAYSANGCFNSIVKGNLVILKHGYGFSPNAFSPNGDGVNDEFVINLTNLQKYRIRIVNRFGNLVFQSDSIFNSWNGKHNNKDLPSGVYYYMIEALNTDNQEIKLNGSVTLIR